MVRIKCVKVLHLSRYIVFVEEDLIINPKDFPQAKLGDIVEIYQPQPEETNPRLLLQIKAFREDLQAKGCVNKIFM